MDEPQQDVTRYKIHPFRQLRSQAGQARCRRERTMRGEARLTVVSRMQFQSASSCWIYSIESFADQLRACVDRHSLAALELDI